MFRYSGPLLSFVVIAVCLGINIARYPVVWEMVDKTALNATLVAQEAEVEADVAPEHQVAQAEPEPKNILSKEGSPVPPPLGGSPSSTRTLFTTNLSKPPSENVSSNGYEPIPTFSVPNHKIANLATPPEVEEDKPATQWIASNEPKRTEEDAEEDLSNYQPISPQPIYAAHYEEQPSIPNEVPREKPRELTPEEKIEAFKNSPMDLIPVNNSDSEFSETLEW